MDKFWIQLIIIMMFGTILGGFASSISVGFKLEFADCLITCWISGLIGGLGGFTVRHFS